MSLGRDALIQQALCFVKENLGPNIELLAQKHQIKTKKPTPLPKKIEHTPPSFTPTISEKKTQQKPIPLPEILEEQAVEPKKTLQERPPLSFTDFSKPLHRLFPQFLLKETPPDDRTALAMANPSYIQALEADVVIFSFQETPESDLFLQNIGRAISHYHTPASLFFVASCKTENELSLFLEEMHAKVVLAPNTLLQKKLFLPFIKELPVSSEYYLHKSRLILLEPFTHYFTQPQQKKALWQTLCNLLKSPNTPASS